MELKPTFVLIPPLPFPLQHTCKHTLPPPLRSLLCRCLPNIQETSPQHEFRAVTSLPAIGVPRRPYATLLRMALASPPRIPSKRPVDRLQYNAVRDD